MNTPTKISLHFHLHEFFSKNMWQSYDETFLRKLLEQKHVPNMERIRIGMDKLISTSTWWWASATSQYRGFRSPSSSVRAL